MFRKRIFRIGCLAVVGILILAVCFFFAANFGFSHSKIEKYNNNISHQHAQHLIKENLFLKDVAHVCLSVDDKTLVGAMAAINSIKQNTRYPVIFHILVTQNAYAYLRRWIDQSELKDIQYEAKIFETDRVLEMVRVRLGSQDLAEPMNYARFYYAEYFPSLHGSALHVDNDCIVQGEIHELLRIRIHAPSIASFSDDCSSSAKRFSFVDNSYQHYINFDNDKIKALKMDRFACSFNTGVYVFNVDRWRSENVTESIEHWMVLNTQENVYGNEKAGGGSQPPVMIVLYGKWTLLDPLWNVRHIGMTQSKKYSSVMIKRAKLLHWSGPLKPWQGSISVPFASAWRKYFVKDPTGKQAFV